MVLKFVNLWILTLFYSVLQQLSLANQYKVPKELTDYMATREMRYHHFLWHNIRNLWYEFDQDTQDQIRNLGWAPPRPAYSSYGRSPNQENNSGEDFLYMHRQMIVKANNIMKQLNPQTQVEGFKTIPIPGDNDYPVPRGGQNEKNIYWKTDDFYWEKLKPAEDKYTDPNYLRTVTLGQLGSQIEFSIHNSLHIRFSDSNLTSRSSPKEPFPYIDKSWDDPSYDWLIDSYASHVNSIFWKIHGWVDDRVEDWRMANNIKKIQWKGTWTGGPMSRIDKTIGTNDGDEDMMSEDHDMRRMKEEKTINVMEEVMLILLKTKKCFYYNCQTKRD